MEIKLNCLNYAALCINHEKKVIEANTMFYSLCDVSLDVSYNELFKKLPNSMVDVISGLVDNYSTLSSYTDICETVSENQDSFFRVTISELEDQLYLISIFNCSVLDPGFSAMYNKNRLDVYKNITDLISIEYNNHVTAILGFASFAKNDLHEESDLYKYFNTIENAAIHAASLTNQLLSFTGINYYRQRYININKALIQNVDLFRKVFPPEINIELNLSTTELLIFWDENQLNQLIINSIINAKEAIDEKRSTGTITISTYCNNENIFIQVKDNGKGIPDDYRSRVFNLNFTTKNLKYHSGLGLAVIDGIIKNMGGNITLDSKIGKGSSFTFTIPNNFVPLEEIIENAEEISSNNQPASLLIVDDKASIRNLATLLLKVKGYQVFSAIDNIEAMDILKNNHVDLVLLDVMMPGMRGDELYFTIRRENKDIQVVLLTGTSNEKLVNKLVRDEGVGLILKPFKNDDFYNIIERKLLDGKRL